MYRKRSVINQSASVLVPTLLVFALAGCGGSSSSSSSSPADGEDDNGDETTSFDLNVFVSGLGSSTGLVLQNNGADDLEITSEGESTFSSSLEDEETYEVTVLDTPTGPRRDCVLENASGAVDGNDVLVEVKCGLAYHALSGQWILTAEPGIQTLATGLTQPGIAIAEADVDEVLVLRDECDSQAGFRLNDSQNEVTLETDEGCEAGDRAIDTTFLSDAINLSFPENTEEGVPAWELNMDRVGAGITDDLPDVASGMARIDVTDPGVSDSRRKVHAVMARKSDDAGIEAIEGEWGIVRLEVNLDDSFEDALYSTEAFPTTITSEDGGKIDSNNIHTETQLVQFPLDRETEKDFFVQQSEQLDIPISVSNDGGFQIDGAGSGFISPDGNLLAWALNEVDGSLVDNLWLFGVRRDDAPDLDGNQYRIIGPSFFPGTDAFEMLHWLDGSVVEFKADNKVDFTFDDEAIFVEFGSGDAELSREEFPPETFSDLDYTVGDGSGKDGLIEVEIGDLLDPGAEGFLVGFAQEGGEFLMLMLGTAEDAGEDNYEGMISMMFAICTNC